MTDTQLDVADKLAMYVGGGLMLLGIPVMGVLNVLAGSASPLYKYEVTKGGKTTTGHAYAPELAPKGAEIVESPLFAPELRAYIVALGMLVFALYAIYRLVDHREAETTPDSAAATAD